MIYTLQYGTYTFPNQTFQLKEIPTTIVTPLQDLRRRDQGKGLDGRLAGRSYKINGKIFSLDKASLWNALNIMNKSIHNQGEVGDLKYRDDNISAKCRMSRELRAKPGKGLYEHLHDIDAVFISAHPYVAGLTVNTLTGSITGAPSVISPNNAGNFPTNPIFTFVGGTWAFSDDIAVENVGNSHQFSYEGPIAAGQTLLIDCDAGCVLLHVGATMVDAISYFSGDLFFELDEGVNTLIIDGATFDYEMDWYHRWYV